MEALSGFLIYLFLLSATDGSLYTDPNCKAGRDAVVHLFEWKWTSIKRECVEFLGPNGYCAVQVSPPNENAVITSPNRPWWERYQPVSYKLVSRSGNEQEFRDMVATCNSVGVRIYVDLVINHMTGDYEGVGTAGDHFDGRKCSYPAVPYTSSDCNGNDNCHSSDGSILDYRNHEEVRNCKLFNLADLRLSSDHVRQTIAAYMNKLLDMGVAGFRVDAAKHMWPGDLENIFSRLKTIQGPSFQAGLRPFMFQEVNVRSTEAVKEREYFNTGRVTSFQYGEKMADIFLRHTSQLQYLQPYLNTLPNSDNLLVFLSNHDNQRGHGGVGAPITFYEPKQLKIATAFMLAYPFGFPRIMSSYTWPRNWQNGVDANNWYGPPHNADMSTQEVQILPNKTCAGGWVCEHRWPEISGMVRFRGIVQGTPVLNWQNPGSNQVTFSRGNKGFFALVADNSVMNVQAQTGLPAGTYCDVISGELDIEGCTGKVVQVDGNGRAHITISGNSEVPVLAIHIDAKL